MMKTNGKSMVVFNIRKITQGDIHQLQVIGTQTFSETFAQGNTEDNLKQYLDQEFSLENLTAELNTAGSEFYFAEHGNNVIGYLKLNHGASQTELKDDKALEIERIYVLKVFHGKKVGRLLYEKAVQIANEKNVDYIWLGVWEESPRAINFYRKNGFAEFDKHIFKLGNDKQTDIMMKKNLKG